MIEIGNIVTLENQKEYLLLEELTKDGIKYVYAAGVNADDTLTAEYLIFEVIVEGADEYLKIVPDQELYDELIEDFKELVANKVVNGEYEGLDEEA